jgi:hypothetical protein
VGTRQRWTQAKEQAMSDQEAREVMGDDLGVWSVDAEDQLQPEDTLDGTGDVLDRGFDVPDHFHGATCHGVRASEQAVGETIDQRIRQEIPDPWRDGDRDGRHHLRPGAAEDGDGDVTDLVHRLTRSSAWTSPEESALHYTDEASEARDLTVGEEWLTEQ